MYNPLSYADRGHLATAIEMKLMECGFERESSDGAGEKVFSRPVKDTGMHIKVYTSIVGDSVRRTGKDAIRVAGVYVNGETRRGIVSYKRVNRTGTIADIVTRMYGRMRTVWSACNSAERCHCGAPKFKSKNNNLVCAEVCWSK